MRLTLDHYFRHVFDGQNIIQQYWKRCGAACRRPLRPHADADQRVEELESDGCGKG